VSELPSWGTSTPTPNHSPRAQHTLNCEEPEKRGSGQHRHTTSRSRCYDDQFSLVSTPAGSSGTGCAGPGSWARWAASLREWPTHLSNHSGPLCNATCWTAMTGKPPPSPPRRCLSGSRASTTLAAGAQRLSTGALRPGPHTTDRKSRQTPLARSVRLATGVQEGRKLASVRPWP